MRWQPFLALVSTVVLLVVVDLKYRSGDAIAVGAGIEAAESGFWGNAGTKGDQFVSHLLSQCAVQTNTDSRGSTTHGR
jgi:hypothetical protein